MKAIRTNISATGSNPVAAGFTLLEMVVVMTIIGITLGFLVLSNNRETTQLHAQGKRLHDAMRMITLDAMTRDRDWGMLPTKDGYAFRYFDADSKRWVKGDEAALQDYVLPDTLTLSLLAPAFLQLAQDTETPQQDMPPILFLSNGQTTAFRLQLEVKSSPALMQTFSTNGVSTIKLEEARP